LADSARCVALHNAKRKLRLLVRIAQRGARARKPRHLSAAVVAARGRHGWSQAELADCIGVGRAYVGDLESGPFSLQLTRLKRLLGELRVDVRFGAGPITLTKGFTAVPGIEPPSDAVSNFLGGYVPEGHHRLVMASRRSIDVGDLPA
jgi:transcriptional regulator with XRE-family HTH domain